MQARVVEGSGQAVLVADDDREVLRVVMMTLELDGFTVHCAKSGQEAVQLFEEHRPGAIVLDLNMPGLDGLAVMDRIRSIDPSTPVIFLTGMTSANDVTHALDAGADDYITKPFHPSVLSARVRAVLRRANHMDTDRLEAPPLEYAGVLIDISNRRVEVNGEEVHFSPTEWDLLQSLASSPGRVVPRADLIASVWGREFLEEHHRLRLSVSRLRNKLEEDPDDPRIITTIHGVGYRLESPE